MNIDFTAIFIVLGICLALPVLIVWIVAMYKNRALEAKVRLISTAIEKKPDINIDELLADLKSKPQLPVGRMLLSRLLAGSICTLAGIAAAYMGSFEEPALQLLGLLCLSVGIGFLINYFVGKAAFKKGELD